MVEVRTQPEPGCPIRPGDACSLCVPGASGPQDCGLVYLVMSDPDLRDRLHQIRTASAPVATNVPPCGHMGESLPGPRNQPVSSVPVCSNLISWPSR